jgi:hypothetical protein
MGAIKEMFNRPSIIYTVLLYHRYSALKRVSSSSQAGLVALFLSKLRAIELHPGS